MDSIESLKNNVEGELRASGVTKRELLKSVLFAIQLATMNDKGLEYNIINCLGMLTLRVNKNNYIDYIDYINLTV